MLERWKVARVVSDSERTRGEFQSEAGAGMTEDRPVQLITDVGDGYDYPYVQEVIRLTRTAEMG